MTKFSPIRESKSGRGTNWGLGIDALSVFGTRTRQESIFSPDCKNIFKMKRYDVHTRNTKEVSACVSGSFEDTGGASCAMHTKAPATELEQQTTSKRSGHPVKVVFLRSVVVMISKNVSWLQASKSLSTPKCAEVAVCFLAMSQNDTDPTLN